MFFGTYHFWVLGVKLSCANLFATPGDLRWLPGVYQMEVEAPGKKPVFCVEMCDPASEVELPVE